MARKKPAEQVAGRYSAIPHAVLDSVAFMGASYTAKALLFELMRQLNGSNNGHVQLAIAYLKERGWLSVDVIQKAKAELIERLLIMKTRFGGLNAGPDMWAVTWLVVSDRSGLDRRPEQMTPGAWHMFVEPEKQKKRSVVRNRTVPSHGTEAVEPVPPHGTEMRHFAPSPVPPHGNNVINHVPNQKCRTRIVGKSGKSGVKNLGRQNLPEKIELQHPAIRHHITLKGITS